MGKAVMISIKPKWVGLIASGEKTVEVRKTRPKIDTAFKCYIYQTKVHLPGYIAFGGKPADVGGKVAGEFVCDWMGEYWFTEGDNDIEEYEDVKNTCLSAREILDYGKGNNLWFWHISALKMYDKPKELSEFQMVNSYKGKWEPNGERSKRIKRPFQSWGYVEGLT